jgi:hypothetical protein
MRNVFDQYSQPENRLSHALAVSLGEDRKFLNEFLKLFKVSGYDSSGPLEVLEQRIPGETIFNFEEDRGLPDLWIHDNKKWCLLIESKLSASPSIDQLKRHARTASRNGFDKINLLSIHADVPSRRYSECRYAAWTQIYDLAKQLDNAYWPRRLAEYMEISETRMVTDEYAKNWTITHFSGIPFSPSHPYNYREARRIIKLAMNELRECPSLQSLGVDKKQKGRTAITGKESTRVWDFLSLRHTDTQNFTSMPHLTLSISQADTHVSVTVPHAIKRAYRQRLTALHFEEFQKLVHTLASNIEKVIGSVHGSHPELAVLQRHYLSQRSTPITDARLEFDLRTAIPKKNPVKFQPEWLKTAHDILKNKQSNIQLNFGARIPNGGDLMKSRESLKVIAGSWLACKPLLDCLLSHE